MSLRTKKRKAKTADELINEVDNALGVSPEEDPKKMIRKKRTFNLEKELLLDLKLLSVNLERAGEKVYFQDDVMNEFLRKGLEYYRKKGLL